MFSRSKIEKASRHIGSEKSGKSRQVSENMVSKIRAYDSPKRDRARCPEGQTFPAGIPKPSQMLHGELVNREISSLVFSS